MDPFFSVHLNKRVSCLDHTKSIDKFFMMIFQPICIIEPTRMQSIYRRIIPTEFT